MELKFKQLHPDAKLPRRATVGASGMDLVAIENVMLHPGEKQLIKTGLAVEIPYGFEIQIRPRSGLSLKTNLRICNSPGTIDQDYKGELCIIMQNITSLDPESNFDGRILIEKGDRIAQAVLCPIVIAEPVWTDHLVTSERGEGAFGSSGMK
jgi:dUTP pyrophosphatase